MQKQNMHFLRQNTWIYGICISNLKLAGETELETEEMLTAGSPRPSLEGKNVLQTPPASHMEIRQILHRSKTIRSTSCN